MIGPPKIPIIMYRYFTINFGRIPINTCAILVMMPLFAKIPKNTPAPIRVTVRSIQLGAYFFRSFP